MKRVLLFILIVCLFKVGFAFNYSPLYFDERIDGEGGFKEFTYTNTTLNPIRYKIVFKDSKTKNDMSKWVKYYPKVLTVQPRSTAKLKVFVKAPKETPQGEYLCTLYSKPIVVPTISKDLNGTVNMCATTVISYEGELTGYVGNPNLKNNIKVEELKIVKELQNKLSLKMINNSFKRVFFGVKILDENENIIYNSGNLTSIAKKNRIELKNIPLDVKELPKKGVIVLYNVSTGKELYKKGL